MWTVRRQWCLMGASVVLVALAIWVVSGDDAQEGRPSAASNLVLASRHGSLNLDASGGIRSGTVGLALHRLPSPSTSGAMLLNKGRTTVCIALRYSAIVTQGVVLGQF